MRRIHKGSFYKGMNSVVIAIEEIERVSSTKYLFEGVVVVDTLNPSNIGSIVTMHAYSVIKTDFEKEYFNSKSSIITATRPSHPPVDLICGNVTSGIEPVREDLYIRRSKKP